MNIRNVLLAGLLPAGLLLAQVVEARPYTYGMQLDIAKVISLEEPEEHYCKVVTATMTYLNSQGEVETLSYLKLAEACMLY